MEKSIQYLLPRLKDAMITSKINPILPISISGNWVLNPPACFFSQKFIVTATQEDKIVSVDMAQSGNYYLKKIIKVLRSEGLVVTK